ncbi:hypothetical protein VaNZ11_014160 [Volvox africanus]|uniref:Uncharacterized protein n=1 Tax=Volvox africanus TaxID=51714 RepID=A0ABQ5SI09_9CHLO|nr:hypothetical protein VaNZ11_014160 [Volvox africanus]
MSLQDHDRHHERVAQRRPPPVAISEPALDSPSGPVIAGAVASAQAGPMMLLPRPKSLGLPRLNPTTAGPLYALSGPADRQPLLYTGDASYSLAALRQDIVTSYRAICGALGEPERSDIVNGSLPPAAALGLPLPPALGAAVRLPALPGESGFPPAPLLLPPAPSGKVAAPGPPGQSVALAMGLGPDIGIEAVGSGADAGARILTPVGVSWGAISRLPAGAGVRSGGNSVMGAMRSLSAGHAIPSAADGLPPLAPGRGAGNHWPLGRPSVSRFFGNAGKGRADSSGGPRVAMISGLSQPEDPESQFLGEDSAVVYPPVGRSFSGGTSVAARAAAVGAGDLGPGQMIDAMEDFRFRSGRSKHIQIEDLDNPSRLIPGFRRNENMQLEVFLKEYARDRSNLRPGLKGGGARYRMPF